MKSTKSILKNGITLFVITLLCHSMYAQTPAQMVISASEAADLLLNNNNTLPLIDYKIDVTKKYRLRSPTTSKELEVEDGLIHKGVKVQQYRGYSRNGIVDGYNQEWVFIPAGTVRGANNVQIPVVRILNYGFLKYLKATINSSGRVIPQLGIAIDQLDADGDDSMWEIVPQQGWQTIKIRSIIDGQFLQFPANSNDGSEMEVGPASNDGRQNFLYTSFTGFALKPVVANNNAPIALTPVSNENLNLSVGSCMPDENALMMLANKNSSVACQQFIFYYKNIRSPNSVFISSLLQIVPNIHLGFSVKLQANNNLNGGNIVIGNTSTNPISYWIMVDVIREPGNYIFFNAVTGKCMEVYNNRTDAGATIGQNTFNNTNNQKWKVKSINQ